MGAGADQSQPTAAMLVIGDEILSGRTRDSNMHYLAGELTRHGIALAEVRVVPDDHDMIIAALAALASDHATVFTSGGIGPTHDDITADAVAACFNVAIGVRDDARDLLTAHYAELGKDFNEARQRMARIPDGATLIENPVSIAPGFTIANVHVMAGVPSVFEAMVASVMPGLTGGRPTQSRSLAIMRGEGDIAGPLKDLAQAYPDLSFGSYPFQKDGIYQANVVLRGPDIARIDQAMAELASLFATDRA